MANARTFYPGRVRVWSVGRNIHPLEGKPKPERKIVLSKKSPLLNASIPKFPPRWCRSATPPRHRNGYPETWRLQQRARISKRCVSITSSGAKGAIAPPVWVAAEVVLCEWLTRGPVGPACVTARLGRVAMTRRHRRRETGGYACRGVGGCRERQEMPRRRRPCSGATTGVH